MVTMQQYIPTCVASGCHSKTSGRSRFCPLHKQRDQAHGSPYQEPLSITNLREPLHRLEKWVKTSEGEKTLNRLVEHYVTAAEKRVREHKFNIDEMYRTGIQYSTPHNQVSHIIHDVYYSKDHRKTVLEMLAMGILWEESPGMFRSDRSYLCELTHIFMRRSKAKAKFKFRASHGRYIASTRYLNRDTRDTLGQWLARELAMFGVALYREWMREKHKEKKDREEIYEMIRASA
jgi:hypothetical protein